MTTTDRDLKALASIGAIGLAVWWVFSKFVSRYSTSDFVNPQAVMSVAATLPQDDEDTFILSAWSYVSDNIKYVGFASDIYFVDDYIKCQDCYTPQATLKAKQGNCVSMSAVLASLLRTRLPADRVYMAIGELNLPDRSGGHAWVQVERQGQWYLLESTVEPKGWVTAQSVASKYIPYTLFNDKMYNCYNSQVCRVSIQAGCDCERIYD